MAGFDALLRQNLGLNVQKEELLQEGWELHPASKSDFNVKKLKANLTAWVNSLVLQSKLTVRSLAEDMSDGLILGTFLSKLTGEEVPNIAIAAAEKGRRRNVQSCLEFVDKTLGLKPENRWSIDGIVEADFVSITSLLVAIAHLIPCPYELPPSVSVAMIHRKIQNGMVKTTTSKHLITFDETQVQPLTGTLAKLNVNRSNNDLADEQEDDSQEKDTFDILFESSPEKLQQVLQLLMAFANKHLTGTGLVVSNLALQFHDGVYFIILIGSLGDFFVPLYNYHLTPTTSKMKLENVNFAFQLMENLGIKRHRWSAVSIVKRDLKSIMRVLYALFQGFKHVTGQ